MRKFVYIFLLAPYFLSSCEDMFVEKCFSGEAEIVRVEIPQDSVIKRVFFMGESDVYLSYGDEQKIELEFPENLIDDIEFTYDRGNYEMRNLVTCKWRKDNYAPKIYMTLPGATRFDLLEYVNLYCLDTLRYNSVKFYSLGTGDIHLLVNGNKLSIQSDYVADITVKGKVNSLSMYYEELGRFYGEELYANEINIKHNGENTVNLYPVKSLKAQLVNIGDIKIYHKPEILEVTEEDTGRLFIIDN